MRLTRRVERLESASGINEPCAVCDAIHRMGDRLALIRKVEMKSSEVYESRCAWCGRSAKYLTDTSDPTFAELYKRWTDLMDAGKHCDPATQEMYSRLTVLFRQRGLDLYGPEYERVLEQFELEMREISMVQKPRFPYVCTVEGCTCRASARAS
jgi:hypothetical protein